MNKRGVTLRQFALMCAAHLPPQCKHVPLSTHREFLARCIDLGLVEQDGDPYFATHELGRCLPPKEERD